MGSLWRKKRAGWYSDSARTEIRSRASRIFWLLGAAVLVTVAAGADRLPSWEGWAFLSGGLGLGVAWTGLWFCRDWGRWLAGAIAGLLAATTIVMGTTMLIAGEEVDAWDYVRGVAQAVALAWIASWLLSPRARDLFHQARSGVPIGEQGREEATPSD